MAVTVKVEERQAEATRDLLVSIARERFTTQGYAATSIEDIVQRAGLRRGRCTTTCAARTRCSAPHEDPGRCRLGGHCRWSRTRAGVRAGLSAFLDAFPTSAAFRRIVVLGSVSVLQSEVREGGIGQVELPMLRTVLTPLAASDVLPGVAVEPLAHVALGGLRHGAAPSPAHPTPTPPDARSTWSSTPSSADSAHRLSRP